MSNNNLQFIVDRFYLNKFIKDLDIIKLLDLTLVNNDYNNFLKKMYSPKVKTIIYKICNILKKYTMHNVYTNELVYAFILYKYHYIILNQDKEIINVKVSLDLKFNLTNTVIKLIDYLICFDMLDDLCILKFCNRYKKYINALNEWDNADKIKLVRLLFESYTDLQIAKEDIINNKSTSLKYKNEITKIDSKQKNIINEIYHYGGMDIIKKIKPSNNFNLINYKYDDYLWELLDYELKAIPIEFSSVIKRIIELKYIMYNIIPKNKEILSELESTIYITDIDSKNIDCHYILTSLNYFFNRINVIQDKYSDMAESYHKILKEGLIDGTEIFRFVPDCLKFLVYIYYKIWDDKVCNKMNLITN